MHPFSFSTSVRVAFLLAVTLLAPGLVSGRAQSPAAGKQIILLAGQSTGGILGASSNGTQTVILDKSSAANFPKAEDARIEWKLPAVLSAGWWKIIVESSLSGMQYANRNLEIGFISAQKPAVNIDGNITLTAGTPQRFECWIYSSAPVEGVMLRPLSDLWRHNSTWPVTRVTIEHVTPLALTPRDAVTLSLTVAADGSVELPLPLPAGNYSVSLGAKKPGATLVTSADKRTIDLPFSFDRWQRPRTSYFYSGSSVQEINLQRDKTDTAFKTVMLKHTAARTYEPILVTGLPVPVVDEKRTQSAPLVMLGSALTGELPAFTLLPRGLRTAVLTTWDDGAEHDLRCAEILNKHGYRPSFFMNYHSKAMEFLDKLEALNVEIGSHCYTHPWLYMLPPQRAAEECLSMRIALEQKLGHPVISMAYPNGYFPSLDADGDYVLRAVKAAGLWSARTTNTRAGRVDDYPDLAAMDTDGFFGFAKELTAQWEKTRQIEGGVFYFWGHSWQIGKTDEQWQKFDDFVAQFARQPDAWYASQGEFSLWLWSRKNVKITAAQKTSSKTVVTLSRPWLHPYLSSRCPLTLAVPAGVEKVLWQGKEIPVANGRVELPWIQ
ncbi:MAG: polysaccharide deacetylase family protein [Rariglobus sp.]